MKLRYVELNEREMFKLKVMDAHKKMEPNDVRYLCKLFGIGKSTFYRWRSSYNSYNLSSLKYRSRRPKNTKTIPWSAVVEICEWKRLNPKKSHYYLYQTWIKEERNPPYSPKTIYNWWKKRGLIVSTKYKKRKRRGVKLFNQAKQPGELVQMDVKYVNGRKRFQYTAIDVVSRWRFIYAYRKFNQLNSIGFTNKLIMEARVKGITITRIQTDNSGEFQSNFVKHLENVGIKHQYI